MVGGERGIQVLNISNVNAQGKTVLNDGKLLELIQQYPFLYNPRVRPYGDEDYSMWAWKRINAAFNRNYENDPFAAFSISDLMGRWQVLKPLIQCLSKAYDLQAIPSSLRQSVMHISTELDNQTAVPEAVSHTSTQSLLQQHMSEIGNLPLEKRIELENEILNLMLDAEMEEYKQIHTLDKSDIAFANREADEFLHDMGFKQVLETALNQQSKIYNNGGGGGSLANISMTNGSGICRPKEEPQAYARQIALTEVHNYIRPCYVNMKRMNLEDYLPLSKIKKMKFYNSK